MSDSSPPEGVAVGGVKNRGPVREKGESGIKKVLVLILLMLA